MDSVFYHDYEEDNRYDDTITVTDDMNVDFTKIGQDEDMVIHYDDSTTNKTKKKRSTKSADSSKVIKVDNGTKSKNNGLEPYSNKYKETNDLLRGVVFQIDNSL